LLRAVIVLLAVWPAGRGAAQSTADDATRATARQLGEQGIEAYWAEDYATADDKLDKAYRLFAVPTLGLWSARAHVRLGHLVEAAERYRDAARAAGAVGDSAAQKEAQRTATQELSALLPRIPSLTIQLEDAAPADVSITIDGVAMSSAMIGVGRPTNPGPHQLEAVRGSEHHTLDVLLVEKEQAERSFRFRKLETVQASAIQRPLPIEPIGPVATPPLLVTPNEPVRAEPPAELATRNVARPLAVAALSLGGAGLLTSVVTALTAKSKLSGPCKDKMCESESAEETYSSLRTASAVSFYLGAAFAVGGVVTWFVAPKRKQNDARVDLTVGPRGVMLHRSF
jgi:hypothetical protein